LRIITSLRVTLGSLSVWSASVAGDLPFVLQIGPHVMSKLAVKTAERADGFTSKLHTHLITTFKAGMHKSRASSRSGD